MYSQYSNFFYNLIKKALPFGLISIIFLYILTTDTSVAYFSRKLARTSKKISQHFREVGMDATSIEGRISLGLLSFKVQSIDTNKKVKASSLY